MYEPIVKDLMVPEDFNGTEYIVALCEDGKVSGAGSSRESVRENLGALFQATLFQGCWGAAPRVRVEAFSFIGNSDTSYETLRQCHLFYFAGIRIVSDDLRSAMQNSSLVNVLKGRVQYNEIAFLAVCGGARASGCTHYYGMLPLDLLNGVHIEYSANVSPNDAVVHTDQKTIGFTTGCASFLILTSSMRMAKSIPVLKNTYCWGSYAAENTRALQAFLDYKAQEWTIYKFGQTYCYYFNLCGKMCYNSDYSDAETLGTSIAAQRNRRSHWDIVYYHHGVHEV